LENGELSFITDSILSSFPCSSWFLYCGEDILSMETEEKRLLARALKATRGNVRRAAQLLRIGRATLYRKIQVYKLRLN